MADDSPTLAQIEQVYGQLPTVKEFFYDWYGGNVALFQTINSIHGPDYDALMTVVTELGNKHFFLPYISIIAIYAVFSLLYKKIFRKGGLRHHFFSWIAAFAIMACSFAVYAVIVAWMKDYFAFPRPYMLLNGVVQLEDKAAEDAYRSFPSGHVAFISLMVFSLWLLLSYHMRLFGLFLIGLVAWSRMALGVHFPADTLWSCALGFCIVYCVRAVIHTFFARVFGIYCDGV